MAKITKAEITKVRLIELSNTLNAIIQELIESIDAPVHNPKKKENEKAKLVAYYLDELDKK